MRWNGNFRHNDLNMDNIELISDSWQLNDCEKARNNRDTILTLTGLTAGTMSWALMTYLDINPELAWWLSIVLITIYKVGLIYLSRKYNWLRVDKDNNIRILNKIL